MSQPPNNQPPGQPGQPGPEFPGQQPQGGQPFPPQGQPTPGQPYQQGQPDPYAGQPPQDAFQPKKKGGIRQILSLVVTVAVLAAGGFFLWQNFTSNAALEPGKCITVGGETDDAEHKEVKCDDADTFSYLVTEVFDGEGTCASDNVAYTSVSTSRRGGSERTTKTTCLIPQFTADKCYKELPSSNEGFEAVACDGGGATFKVTKVEESATAECEAPTEPWAFSKPGRTYCLELF